MSNRPPLSLQLYTLRAALAEDFAGTMRRVAELGFENVEPFGLVSMADELATALEANHLSAPSAHAGLLGQDQDEIFSTAARLGIATVIEPHVDPARWQDADEIGRIAAELNVAAKKAAEYGIRVGYHNHWFELESVIGGRTGLEILSDDLGEAVVLELDTYWAAAGGQDVIALLARLGDRVRFLHVKDGPVEADPATQVAVGQGAMPIWDIIATAESVEYAVVELDDFSGEMFEAVADSYAYLTAGPAA